MEEINTSLSRRLNELINMVPECACLYDVGCDHGYSSINIVLQKKCEKAFAMDVRKGPLSAARQHITEAGLDRQITTILSDGLKEVDQVLDNSCILISGMGGELMSEIIAEAIANQRLKGDTCMVLQPQSELRRFREFLYSNGFVIVDEAALFEEGKYYFLMKVTSGEGHINDYEKEFGPVLLKRKDGQLKNYLIWKSEVMEKAGENLFAHGVSEKSKARMLELKAEIVFIEETLKKYYEN